MRFSSIFRGPKAPFSIHKSHKNQRNRIAPYGWLLTAFLALPAWSSDMPAASIDAAQRETLGLSTQTLSPIKRYLSLPYHGHLVSPNTHQWQLSTPLSGRVSQVHRVDGAVKAGEPIVTLESADLLALQNQYLNAQTDATPLKAAFERAQRLSRTGAVSDRQYQEARAALDKNRQRQQQLSQTLQLAGLSDDDLKRLRQTQTIHSDNVVIRAPVDGVLNPIDTRPGQRLAADMAIGLLTQKNTLTLELALPKERAQRLRMGQHVQITGQKQPGLVTFISPTMHPVTQTVLVRVRHPNTEQTLMAGEMVTAQIVWQAPFVEPAAVYRAPAR
ncbi:MAG: efflux RND transporter periplasmic adaptor subunit, partial [Hydrogenovibrio sp.]|uniref:efflux RND transporter periplasmic adaptor subunit n=1 Tax=Hydrogenovibrio sp. TaxID=2065821 RepID=UPI00287031A6